jgi:orotate phosphoribosyltransferase
MTAQADSVLTIFRDTGAYLSGHFRLTSGLHSPEYLQCALVLQHPARAEQLGVALAAELRHAAGGETIGVVVSPAMGGLIIGHEVARALGTRFLFTERDASSGKMILRRGFSLQPNEAAVVVEDVITTGGSTREVIEIVRAAGARPIAAGSILDRSGGAAQVGAPRLALAMLTVVSYPPDECPLCRQGLPVSKPGSRATPGGAG